MNSREISFFSWIRRRAAYHCIKENKTSLQCTLMCLPHADYSQNRRPIFRAPATTHRLASGLILSMITLVIAVRCSKSRRLRSFHRCHATIMNNVDAPFLVLGCCMATRCSQHSRSSSSLPKLQAHLAHVNTFQQTSLVVGNWPAGDQQCLCNSLEISEHWHTFPSLLAEQ
jgi:hypothetical protein